MLRIIGLIILFSSSCIAQTNFDSLPNNGRVWSILQDQTPLIAVEPLDLGGLETGSLPRFGTMGASWTQNQYLLNEFDVTNPYTGGTPLLDPHLTSLNAVETSIAAKPASDSGTGGNVRMTTPTPVSKLNGAAQLFFSNGGLQNNHALSEE